MNEKFCFSIRFSLKFVPKGPFDNKLAMVQVMAWRRTGDKPLPEPMLTHFPDAYIGTRGRWVMKPTKFSNISVWTLKGPLLLTWICFNPSMDKQLHPL